ncbi:MAG: outer membrane beta-barrel domain-containing protein [Myxococcaceae bacterium]|nr:outer membrane beta-barrel domain-containing protein [Myxococcaceae bacterium]
MNKLSLIVVLLAAFVLTPGAALAQSELENPGSVSAIQERAFRMSTEFNLAIGVLPLDAFTKQVYGQVSFVYHFTDYFAWQVGRGAYGYNWSTGLKAQLEKDYGVLPTTIDVIQFFVGSDLMFSPFYGKAAILNRAVIYYEAYLLVGVSVFKYTNAFRPAANIGGGIRIFQNKYVSYRLEVTDNIVIKERPEQVMQINLMLALNFGS